MKRTIAFVLSFIFLLSFLIQIPAAGSDNSQDADNDCLEMLAALGIFEGNESGDLEPGRAVTREEFAKLMLSISGQESKAGLYGKKSIFPDVEPGRWSNGYIGAAVAQGYMAGMTDGMFHPVLPVNYSQAATAIGKILGYSGSNLVGNWPYNYLNLLESLGILEGIPYQPQEPVLRKYLATMLERMLQTKTADGSKLFVDTTGFLKNMIILENVKIRPDLDSNRVLTDSGVYYVKSQTGLPELGYSYIARVDNGVIQAMVARNSSLSTYSVREVSQGLVLLNDNKSLRLPVDIPYYHNGKQVEPDSVISLLTSYSSVIIASDKENNRYGVVFDPVYSAPRVITGDMSADMLERLYSGKLIDKGGKSIRPSQLEINDVVYEVGDIWNRFSFIRVVANEVAGDITAILPTLVSPASIEIDGTKYELDSSFPVRKINGSAAIGVGNTVKLLLGENGKAVDIILGGTGINSHYAVVVDYLKETSQRTEDYGKTLYYVNLLHTDGNIKKYLINNDPSEFKGDLVTYVVAQTGETCDTVELTGVEYLKGSSPYEVYKDERKLGNYYAADNVIIFNMIHNVYGRNSDVSILKWSDLPAGRLEASKVKYIHTSGDFQDIDVLFLDNVLDEGIFFGLVTESKLTYAREGTLQNLTMLIEGKEYTFTCDPIAEVVTGSVVKGRISGGNILDVERTVNPYTSVSAIQAADSSRIRINDVTYRYHRDLAIYKMNKENTWERVGTSELSAGESSGVITVYVDKPVSNGGKIVMILIR